MADPAGFAKDQLKSIIERIERLEEEKQALADDIKEVYAEAKANGFDTRTLRTVVRLRKQDSQRAPGTGSPARALHACLGDAVAVRVRRAAQRFEATKASRRRSTTAGCSTSGAGEMIGPEIGIGGSARSRRRRPRRACSSDRHGP